MKRTNYLFIGALMLMTLMLNTGCGITPQADQELQVKTEAQAKEANKELGMPNIVNFQEKKVLKMIYELCDQENLVCYAYLFNRNNGSIGQYLGKCIGYGIPYSTQYSNPEKMIHPYSGVYYNLPQAEPNQLFKPTGLSATWLLLIDPATNEPRPVYIEPEIIVSPFKLPQTNLN